MAMNSQVSLMVLLVLSLFLLPTLLAMTYHDCVVHKSYINITDVVEDDGPSFKIIASTSKIITGGNMNVTIKLGLAKLVNGRYDICQYMACPVQPGTFELPFAKIFTAYLALPVPYTVNITVYDKPKADQVMCLNFKFMPSPDLLVTA